MVDFIDTHIHLQDFKPDFAPQVLEDNQLKQAILISTQKDDFEKITTWLKNYPQKFIGAFGIHPWYYNEPWSLDLLEQKLKDFPNAAVGEIGVDALRENVNTKQHQLFSAQLEIAKKYNRPVIVHAAKAFNALIEHEDELKNVRYVHHGFVKNRELLKFIIRTGGYIGLGALFLRQEKTREMWDLMPQDKILFETDAPYQIREENYSAIVQENLQKLAEISGTREDALAEQLMQNAQNFL